MKKFTAFLLAAVLTLALFTGCNSDPTGPVAQEMPGSALEVLETVWGAYAEEEKFPVIGGSMAAPVDNAPGSYDLADENITGSLLIPAEQLANVTEAASMIHMLNANTFTCAVYKLAGEVQAADFAAAMKDAVLNNQWMCGFPETLLIRSFGDDYVLVAFGVNDAMTPFEKHMSEEYPGFETLYNEPIV